MKLAPAMVAGLVCLSLTGLTHAAEKGDWIVRVGAHSIDPKSDNSPVVSVDSATQLTFDFTYLISDHVGVEVLAALPFEHDIKLNGGPVVASTKHLPPTASLNYRFGGANIQPYIGVGLNYTRFSGEKTRGALAGSSLDLDSSIGFAFQVGFDASIGERMLFNAVLRKISIETEADLNGSYLTDVQIDPIAIGVGIGWEF